MSEKIQQQFIKHFKHKMSRKDKELLIESIILTVIYLLSFGVLSMGRVPQTLWGMSESTFGNIQLFALTFAFAVIITLVIYSMYKTVYKKVAQ
jgi:polyferredoxin